MPTIPARSSFAGDPLASHKASWPQGGVSGDDITSDELSGDWRGVVPELPGLSANSGVVGDEFSALLATRRDASWLKGP